MATPNRRKQFMNCKMVLLGDAAVGKSSIVLRLTKNSFSEYGESTIGAAYVTTTVETENAQVKMEVWDTAGQERYGGLTQMFYRGAAAALVVYDITSRSTFERAKRWVQEVQEQPQQQTLIILVGNKVDMESMRQVPRAQAEAYAQSREVLHMESSAKANMNIHEIFQTLADQLSKQGNRGNTNKGQKAQSITVDDGPTEKKGCC